jgi:hypothetical protein
MKGILEELDDLLEAQVTSKRTGELEIRRVVEEESRRTEEQKN